MDEIMTLFIRHLAGQTELTNCLGSSPFKVFPGTVPAKVSGEDVKAPWVTVERSGWSQEMTFSGPTGDYTCPTTIIVVAPTYKEAARIFEEIHTVVHGKHNVTWADRLRVQECTMGESRQVPLMEADGSLSTLQQLVGEMLLFCDIVPAG